MYDAVPFLKQRVGRQQKFRIIIVLYAFKRSVLSVLGLTALEDRIRHLNVGIIHLVVAENKVAFKPAYPADAYHIIPARSVSVNDIFNDRSEIDPVVSVICVIERQIRQIVFLFAGDRPSGFHVESFTRYNDFGSDKSTYNVT